MDRNNENQGSGLPDNITPPSFNKDFECYMERRIIQFTPPIEQQIEEVNFSEQVLNPYEIFMYIHSKLLELLNRDPGNVNGILDKLADKHEILSYIYHMEHSGHAIGFRQMLNKLRQKFGLYFDTPFAEVGSGPGHMTWWLMYEEMIKTGEITLVDINPGFIKYAQQLMEITDIRNPGQHRYNFWEINAEKFAEESSAKGKKFNSIFSCMTLQWTDNPEKIIQAIYESLNPGGTFVIIGEEPPDITSTTPIGVALERKRTRDGQLYDGYKGGKSFIDIFNMCEKAGFESIGFETRIMGMTQNQEKIDAAIRLFNSFQKREISYCEEVGKSYLLIKNYHLAFTVMFRKPEV